MTLERIIQAIPMEPYYREEAGVIYNCDCLDILPKIPDKSIDLVLTDPPYMPPAQHYSSRDERWSKCWGDYSPMVIFFQSWLRELKRIAKLNRSVFIFANDQSYPVTFVSAIGNWDYIRCLKWDKGDNHFSLGTGFVFRPRSELIAHCHNQNPYMTKVNRGDILREAGVPNKERFHPAEKPMELMRQLISATTEQNDIMLDNFVGGGSSIVAAKQLGRQFIGIEIEQKYCDIAVQRLAQGVLL